MTAESPRTPEHIEFPTDWDVIDESPQSPEDSREPRTSRRAVAAAAWADLAVILALCAAALATCRALGFEVSATAVPWAVAMAVLVWLVLCAVLLGVRRSWPGVLLIGAGKIEPVDGVSASRTLMAAIVGVVTLGCVPALCADRLPWRRLSQ